jgi:hypothetical protein
VAEAADVEAAAAIPERTDVVRVWRRRARGGGVHPFLVKSW